MDSTRCYFELDQTIAAIATPPGEGGVAIIRISGKKALCVADKMFSGSIHSYSSHTAHLGKILGPEKEVIDEGLALVMRGPHSYTGEDVVEFHCHGGVLITRKVLGAALALGARAALPGEFSFRAFQNGKIDLTKAEGVQKVIAAQSERAWQVAQNQLEGKLEKTIHSFQKRLLDVAALLEAWVDFPEEGLEWESANEAVLSLEKVMKEMEILKNTFYEGKKLEMGFSLCLLGPPNAGKSSLMNALLKRERAIVTPFAGTTRDLIEEEFSFSGIPFRLIDTAGIREGAEVIEKEGIERAKKAAQGADLILLVVEVGNPILKSSLLELLPKEKTIFIWNKVDLPYQNLPPFSFPHKLFVSAKTGEGLPSLKQVIESLIWKGNIPSKEEVVLTSERHLQAIQEGMERLKAVCEGLKKGLSPEFLASDIRLALKELGAVIGIEITEEILSAIFSKFCVGK